MSAKAPRTPRPNRPKAPSVAKRPAVRAKRRATAAGPDIISTVDGRMPVTLDEVDVIEQYLGHQLDELLAQWISKAKKQRHE